MILAAEEYREDTRRLPPVVDVKPVDGPSDGEMPQAGQEVVMALSPTGRGQDPLRGRTDLDNPR